jgi:four helix bundle protein
MKTHKDLEVWKKAIDMVTQVYRITNSFPKEELYALTNQIRRSAVSVPSNIAEGAGRSADKEFLQFLNYATGSLSELETQMIIAYNLGYINAEQKELVNELLATIFKMLAGLIAYVKKKNQ